MTKTQLLSKVSEAIDVLHQFSSHGRWKAAGRVKLKECMAELEAIKSILASKGKQVNAAELLVRVYGLFEQLHSLLDELK